MNILIHDGRRVGHLKWATNAVEEGVAQGIIISPFSTPRVSEPRKPSGRVLAEKIRDLKGEVIFDAMTHARMLHSTNKLDCYDTWELWRDQHSLISTPDQIHHLERVFSAQQGLDTPLLTPSVLLKDANGPEADKALSMGYIGRGMSSDVWQSLAGTASFWASEESLDQYIGQLVALRSTTWVLTCVIPDNSNDPELIRAAQLGFYRTVSSLSVRSRVIVSHADFDGLPSIAAGATTLGTGWDKSMRSFDPLSFVRNDDGSVRIPASYVTQANLLTVMRRDTAEAINTYNAELAGTIRGGKMPLSDQEERTHHLRTLHSIVDSIKLEATPQSRLQNLLSRYEKAIGYFDTLAGKLGSRMFSDSSKNENLLYPYQRTQEFGRSEGLI